MNSMRTCCTPPRDPVRLRTLITLAYLGSVCLTSTIKVNNTRMKRDYGKDGIPLVATGGLSFFSLDCCACLGIFQMNDKHEISILKCRSPFQINIHVYLSTYATEHIHRQPLSFLQPAESSYSIPYPLSIKLQSPDPNSPNPQNHHRRQQSYSRSSQVHYLYSY